MYKEKRITDKLKVFMIFAFIPLFVFLAVVIVPFIFGVIMTFTDWNGFSTNINFLGLTNYQEAFTDSQFWDSMIITFKYVVFTLVFTNVLALLLALIVTSGLKGQNFFRLGFFVPNLIGGVILGFIWQFIFARVVVYVGQSLHLEIFSHSWLADPDKAFWTLVIVGVWQSAGYMMLIYIAGLMGVSPSLLEAAKLDGASGFQQLLKIKIPLMVPAFTISIFLTLQRSFMVYDTNLSLTGGGPFRSTELITMHVYNEAFLYQNFGPGQSKAFILFIIVAIISMLQVSLLKKREVEL